MFSEAGNDKTGMQLAAGTSGWSVCDAKTCTLLFDNSTCHDVSMQLLHRGLACLLCQEVGKRQCIWEQGECVHCGYAALPQRPNLPPHQAVNKGRQLSS